MKNISLKELILKRVGKHLEYIAVVGSFKTLLYSDLISVPDKLFGQNVILYIADPVAYIKALVSLDGSVKKLCPISTLSNKEDLMHLLTLGEFDTVVSDLDESDLEIFRQKNLRYCNVIELDTHDKERLNNIKYNTTWLIPTSGTTSRPKLVRHKLASLASSALKSKNYSSETRVWGQFYDFTRFAGYQILFNSLLNGHTIVMSSFYDKISERIQHCSENLVTHISATPTQWRKILMSGVATKIPLKQIILGGEAADQSILNALRKSFPMAKITHTYASTEAGLGISVSDGLAGFPVRFLESSRGSVDLKIRKENLFLRSSSSALGYNDDTKLKDQQGWIDTGDLVKIEEGRFYIIGRTNGIINVGGDKVNPEHIRHILLKHPNIEQVRIYGKKSPITGMVLAADIQLKNNINEKVEKNSIKTFVKDKFQPKDQPRIINIVGEILINSTGKLN